MFPSWVLKYMQSCSTENQTLQNISLRSDCWKLRVKSPDQLDMQHYSLNIPARQVEKGEWKPCGHLSHLLFPVLSSPFILCMRNTDEKRSTFAYLGSAVMGNVSIPNSVIATFPNIYYPLCTA